MADRDARAYLQFGADITKKMNELPGYRGAFYGTYEGILRGVEPLNKIDKLQKKSNKMTGLVLLGIGTYIVVVASGYDVTIRNKAREGYARARKFLRDNAFA